MHSMEDDLFFGAIPQSPEEEPSPIKYSKPANTGLIPAGTFIFDYSGDQPQFHPLLDSQNNAGPAGASGAANQKKGWVNFENETTTGAKVYTSDRKSKKSRKKTGDPSGVSATAASGSWPVSDPGTQRSVSVEPVTSGRRSRHGSGYEEGSDGGRRSAPVFSRRLSFSSSEHTTPGQPNYSRSSSIRKSFSRRDSETGGKRPRAGTKHIRERSLSESGETSRRNSIQEENEANITAEGRGKSIKGFSKKRSNSHQRRDSYGSTDGRLPGEYYSETEALMASRYAYGGDDWRTESDDAKMSRLFHEAAHRPDSDSSRKFSVWSTRNATPLSDLADPRRPSTGELAQTNFNALANQQGQTFTVTDGKLWPPRQPSRGIQNEEDSSTDDDEKKQLLTSPNKKTQVYAVRWYLLFIFCSVSFVWNAVWATWGPISQSAKAVYGWDDSDIATFTWLGNAPFLITSFPLAYLMDEKGMRPAMLLCCALMTLGTGIRCIPADNATATWLIRAGQLINGIAGAVPVSGPTLLSGLWFPANQRTTGTAMATVLGYLGTCAAVVVAPLIVPEPELAPINGSSSEAEILLYYDDSGSGNSTDTDYSLQRSRINLILYAECAASGVLFVLSLIYFPSRPPKPPSLSAAVPREQYLTGILKIIRNKQFWVTAIAYSLPTGIYEVWQIVLDLILGPKGVSQITVGWMDFYTIMAGCVSSLLISRFADYFTRQMKLFLIVFYFLAAGTMLWFCCMLQGFLPFNEGLVYASLILGGILLDGGAPLFFELVIEVSYPVGEGVASGCLMFVAGGIGIIFLALLEIKNLGNDWVNWLFAACIALAIPLLLCIKTDFSRADVDEGEDYEDSDLESSSSEDDGQIRKI